MDGDVQNKKVPWIQGSTRKVFVEISKQLPSAEGSVGRVNINTITGNVGIHSPKATLRQTPYIWKQPPHFCTVVCSGL